MIRKGTRVQMIATGETAKVVSVVKWDRTYYLVRFVDGVEVTVAQNEIRRAL